MNKNLISILTPTHNRGETFLPLLIGSIQKQRYEGFDHEHIIIDNCSTDNTQAIVKALAKKDKRIKYVKNKRNIGPADALNLGFKKSKGSLIVPLDDDDMIPYKSLQFRFDYMKEHKDIDWSYGYTIGIDERNRLADRRREFWVTHEKNLRKFFLRSIRHFFTPNSTMTIRRKCIDKVGGWNENLRCQDWDIVLKLLHKGFKPGLISSYLSYYRIHKKQLTPKHLKEGVYSQERDYFMKLYGVTPAMLKPFEKLKG